MKLQIKVFDEEHEEDLEDQVNDFLKEIEPHSFVDLNSTYMWYDLIYVLTGSTLVAVLTH